jgi:hypothetical protein
MSSDSLLKSTNTAREANKESDLNLNTYLSKAAQTKAEDMVAHDYWSHNTPDGTAPWAFVINSGYQYQKAAENLAYGFANSSDTVTGWMNSPSHRENILDRAFTDVGFGYAKSPNFTGKGPVTVVVAYYGRPITATPYVASVQDSQPKQTQTTTPTTAQLPQKAQTVSRFDSLTSGLLPGATYIFVFLMGAALAALVIKHGLAIKKAISKGEKYAIAHPLFDITLVALVVVAIIAIGKVGVIL